VGMNVPKDTGFFFLCFFLCFALALALAFAVVVRVDVVVAEGRW